MLDEIILKFQGPGRAMRHIGLRMGPGGDPELTEKNAKILMELLFDDVFIDDLKDLYGEVTAEKRLSDAKYLREEFPKVSYAAFTLACDVFCNYIKVCEDIGRPHRYVDTH